jgi:hypothetical protein
MTLEVQGSERTTLKLTKLLVKIDKDPSNFNVYVFSTGLTV